MSLIDYSIFAREKLDPAHVNRELFDVFISSYNDSERVQRVFNEVVSPSKTWLVHPEYGYEKSDVPTDSAAFFGEPGQSAVEFWQGFLDGLDPSENLQTKTVGIDITGMMRPHLMLLPLMLRLRGLTRATFFYSDPQSYSSGDSTKFSKGPIEGVTVVPGMEGTHRSSVDSSDLLIIGAGYDHTLVQAAAENKRSAQHFMMLGLPSLQPHMYQESVLRLGSARESISGYREGTFLFAPANDPFMTAQVLSDHILRMKFDGKADNVYLSPVGSKAQVLGFSWYFWCEARDTATSVVFPYSSQYERETSIGISCVHSFTMELDMIGV